jgi:GNAT superfamily N-acetyltransferase
MHIVPLRPDQGELLADHLVRLDADDRSMRFMGSLHDESLRDYVARFDWQSGRVLGLWVDGVLRGAVELRFESADGGSRVEAALTVETAWQGQGAGTRLLRRAIVVARNRSASGLRLICFGDNQRLQHLARKFGARLEFTEGEAEALIAIRPADYLSLRDECVANWVGYWQAWLAQWSAAKVVPA